MFDDASIRDRGRRHTNTLFFTSRNVCYFFYSANVRLAALLFSARSGQKLNAKTKVHLQKICATQRRTRNSRSRWDICFLPVCYLLSIWVSIFYCGSPRGTFDATRDEPAWRFAHGLHTGSLNFIRPRLYASFETNRCAIGARCPRICCVNTPRTHVPFRRIRGATANDVNCLH